MLEPSLLSELLPNFLLGAITYEPRCGRKRHDRPISAWMTPARQKVRPGGEDTLCHFEPHQRSGILCFTSNSLACFL
jgi:hypothetical protein